MQRAIISIGIRQTGGLPELQAAHASAQAFADWGRQDQKIPASRVRLVTDARGKVGRERLYDEVEKIVALGYVEQLIVYFSGHGINSGLYEQWLLSRAPDDPGAAVNLRGSEMLARFCGIPHVVFISDACRTAAASIQAQGVTGGEIFPNPSARGVENPVDQYFAALVGNPAYEVKTVEDAVSGYRAAYSTVLLQALRGAVPGLIDASSGKRLIRPRPLKKHLAIAVPDYLHGLQLTGGQTQQPDARIESDDTAWLAELPAETTPRGLPQAAPAAARPPSARANLAAEAAQARLASAVASSAVAFDAEHFETRCGIQLRGARLASAGSRQARVVVGAQRDAVQVDLQDAPAANVLVRLDDGSCVVVPAFRDTVTGLRFDAEGNLDDVWCQPSANTGLYEEWQRRSAEIGALRARLAAASSLGVFRLEDQAEGVELVKTMREIKAVDPAMAVYAAWALHDRRLRAQVVDMQRYMDASLHVRLFDVAMLAFTLGDPAAADARYATYPCVPMLTQGWALLAPLGVTLPGHLAALRSQLRPSLWTHFAPAAFAPLQAALC